MQVETWHCGFHYHHTDWSKIYYLIIYLFNEVKQHIKSPDSDQANSIGKCTLERIGAVEKGCETFINNIHKLSWLCKDSHTIKCKW